MKKTNQPKGPIGRRRYDEEFRKSAVQLVAGGRSVPEVARSLGISENILYRWRSAAQAEPSATAEVAALRRQVKQLEQERDILKKALSIFSRAT